MFSHSRCRQRAGVILLILCNCAALSAATPVRPHVIFITIDGLAASYLSDAHAPIPTLRRLAATGAVAEGLRVSNPAVTWPNHTTLVTGVRPDKHSVLCNGLVIRRGPGQPVIVDGEHDKSELVNTPTLYDQLHAAGFRTANINWPCTRGTTNLDDNFPDVPNAVANMSPRLRLELIRAGILESDSTAAFREKGAVAADEAWMAAAEYLLRNRPPDFLLLHLLNTDAIQHKHGPQSPPAYTAVALADAHIARLLRVVNESGLSDQTTIFIASDHGFARPTKLISPNVLLRKAGLLRPAPNRRAQAISEGGVAYVYLTNPDTATEDRARVIELLSQHEGIAEIVKPEGYAALRFPDPAVNPQMGDLLLVAKDGYAFSNESDDDNPITEITSPVGTHGYLTTNPKMNGVFIAWGAGIKAGAKLGVLENIDIAPTIAAVFGEKLPVAEGKIIREILTAPAQH